MNYRLFVPGITFMVLAALVLIFGPELSVRAGIGIIFLSAIGLGLTVAGSPDPSKKEKMMPLGDYNCAAHPQFLIKDCPHPHERSEH